MVYTYYQNDAGHFVCPHCHVVKKNQNTMHYHYKTHDDDLKCKHCREQFTELRTLNTHIRIRHPDETKKISLDCPHEGCDKKFDNKGNRRIHYFRIHLKDVVDKLVDKKEAGYTCKGCDKELVSQTAIYYHIGDCIILPDGDKRVTEVNEVME